MAPDRLRSLQTLHRRSVDFRSSPESDSACCPDRDGFGRAEPAQAGSAEHHPADPASGRILGDQVVDYSRDRAVGACAERPASVVAAFGRVASGNHPLEHSASAAYRALEAAAAAVAVAFQVDIVREVPAWVAFPVGRGTAAAAVVAEEIVELGVAEQIVAAAAAVAELAAAAVDTVEEDSCWVDHPWPASAVPALAVHP